MQKRMILVGALLCLGAFSFIGCDPQRANDQVQRELTDPNSSTQDLVGDVNEYLDALAPVVQIVEKTPFGQQVSWVFNGISFLVAAIYGLRQKKSAEGMRQLTVAQQAAKSLMSADARELLAMANTLIQSPDISGMVKEVKATNKNQIQIEDIVSILTDRIGRVELTPTSPVTPPPLINNIDGDIRQGPFVAVFRGVLPWQMIKQFIRCLTIPTMFRQIRVGLK